jgi:hypothetical protein
LLLGISLYHNLNGFIFVKTYDDILNDSTNEFTLFQEVSNFSYLCHAPKDANELYLALANTLIDTAQ